MVLTKTDIWCLQKLSYGSYNYLPMALTKTGLWCSKRPAYGSDLTKTGLWSLQRPSYSAYKHCTVDRVMHKVAEQMFIGFISDDENSFNNKTIFFYKNMKGTLRDVCLDWAVIASRIVYSLESTHLVLVGWKTVNNLNSFIKLHHQDMIKNILSTWGNICL